ncbi:hypothetical protein [Haloferax sp. Q22]|uniref:hypothetical protein n=1 Tax=Haloferax sp. (strain Q22) TaxID=1526048 RepID=UPI000737D643|nr:hypothetical protein [Haloferax sp. Q22]
MTDEFSFDAARRILESEDVYSTNDLDVSERRFYTGLGSTRLEIQYFYGDELAVGEYHEKTHGREYVVKTRFCVSEDLEEWTPYQLKTEDGSVYEISEDEELLDATFEQMREWDNRLQDEFPSGIVTRV